jgi:hypothetical protein
MKDNLVSGTVVAEPPPATAGVLANGGWLDASLGPCPLVTFRLFLSTSIAVAGGPAAARAQGENQRRLRFINQ